MNLPREPLAVVFDMDGLICDTEVVYRDAMIAAAAEHGYAMSVGFFLTLVGLPETAGERRLYDHFGADFPMQAFSARVTEQAQLACDAGVPLKAGVAELLDHLDLLNLPRAIATSSGPAAVRSHLGQSGVIPRFHTIVARGDYERGKPYPDPFLTAAQRLGVPPEACLALEDSHNGVRSAASAGMMTVMVPDLLEPTDEMRGLCVRIARDLHEVRGWLPTGR